MKILQKLCWVAMMGVAIAASTAEAQGNGKAASSSAADAARPHYEKGRALENAGKIDQAYVEYQIAYKLYGHWQIAGTLGSAALKLGKNVEAAERLTQFLREAQGVGAAERASMESQLTTARSKVGSLAFETAAGSELFVGGKSVGKAPLLVDVFVEPGTYEVEAKKAGNTAKGTVDVGAGKREVVKLRYGSAGPAPSGTAGSEAGPTAPATGTASGTSGAGGITTPARNGSDTSGKPGGSGSSPRTVAMIMGGGLTAVTAGVGVITTILSIQKSHDLVGKRFRENQYIENERATLANVAVSSFLAAGVILGATVGAVVLLRQKDQTTARIEIRPAGVGVEIRASW